jgi:hypothetical protein
MALVHGVAAVYRRKNCRLTRRPLPSRMRRRPRPAASERASQTPFGAANDSTHPVAGACEAMTVVCEGRRRSLTATSGSVAETSAESVR